MTFVTSTTDMLVSDTNIFTTWLHQAANLAGYRAPERMQPEQSVQSTPSQVITAPSQRLKGKARKLAKASGQTSRPGGTAKTPPSKSVKYKVNTAQLLDQAKAVAESGAKNRFMPTSVQAVLKRAISARQRCAAYYAKIGAAKAKQESHNHFIGILQRALSLLGVKESKAGPSKQEPRSQASVEIPQLK